MPLQDKSKQVTVSNIYVHCFVQDSSETVKGIPAISAMLALFSKKF